MPFDGIGLGMLSDADWQGLRIGESHLIWGMSV
jgi:hypothetical protein